MSPQSSLSANLFVDPDADVPTAPDSGRRGRGLVVTVEDPSPRPGEPGRARFTRAPTGLVAWPALARQVARADRNARRMLQRIVTQRYGALIAFMAAAVLLLALSWLGLSLRVAANEQDRLRDQRAAAMRSVAGPRTVRLQRDQARRAAATAHHREVRAQSSRRAWKRRAERTQRQLTAVRAGKRQRKG